MRAVPATRPSAGVRDQVGGVASQTLGGDGESPVLDERPRVDEVGDVLACRPSVRGMASLDCVGARRVLGQRAPPQQLGVIVAHP
jgi:hypothetical protein